MDKELCDKMNKLLDVLFIQIGELGKDKKAQAENALAMWKYAKDCEFIGLGPMEARYEYISAYKILKNIGLEVGGMIKPYIGP